MEEERRCPVCKGIIPLPETTCPRCRRGPAMETEESTHLINVTAPQSDSTALYAPSDQTAEQPPPALPGLELQGQLGHGGFGAVYAAIEATFGREVAVKMLRASSSAPALVER
ncbi:MAG: hypothetical protein N3A66_03920, partial [Planctomycetota bacterium]|nr:hypothetical protein [Planctomycetota bacterium]